jgi:2-methylcitrate dehydratase PrpD
LEDISKIVVYGFHEMKRLGNRIPQTEEEAQFNVAWPLAVFLMYGEVSPHHMLKETLSDQKLISLTKKISVTESEEMNQAHRQDIYPCRVEVFLHNERRLESGIVRYKHSGAGGGNAEYGDYTRHGDAASKFMHITKPVLDRTTAHALLELVENLDSLEDLTPFITLWAAAKR